MLGYLSDTVRERHTAAGFCASVPGFRAALCNVLEGLAAQVAAGQPREPAAWPVPEHIVARVQCSSSSDARQLCHVCRPVVVSKVQQMQLSAKPTAAIASNASIT